MKKIYLILIFFINVYADTPPSFKVLDYYHFLCNGTDISRAENNYFMEAIPDSDYLDTSSENSSKLYNNLKTVYMKGIEFKCSPEKYSFEYDEPDNSDLLYFNENGNQIVWYKYNVIESDILYEDLGIPTGTPPSFKVLDYDHEYCGGSSTHSSNDYFMEAYPTTEYLPNNSTYYETKSFNNMHQVLKNGETYYCSENTSNFEYQNTNDSDLVYFKGNTTSLHAIVWYKYNVINEDIRTNDTSCQDIPDNNIFNGLKYQGKATDNSSCQSMYNDNGDGNGYQFVNTDLSGECLGFCYYNLPDSTDTENNTDNGDNNNSSNTDNTDTTNDNISDGTETELSDLIPYLDEVEEKNQNIKDSLDTLNNNLNTQFNSINSNNTNLNNTMSNLNTTLQTLNTKLDEIDNSENDDSNYDGLTDDFEINPSIDGELSNFQGDIENRLTNTFDTYSNVFGFGGYGSAPAPITFNAFGKTYTIFDIKYLNPYIDQIRNIFLVAAYIFGLFLVFKGV
ncbi:hypothetical protein [Arcobacter arenosus]|uniref:Uncharacterized protein n=1 Tax=Arcobacter arenosus TaxID=2576037 RepID=A0A5R8XYI9_9BACT|nr:hypothetical protein [Arcobacter arenosus]TLP36946.1 hypothetical protein FDK22_11930 [Arcobacter arenosus]